MTAKKKQLEDMTDLERIEDVLCKCLDQLQDINKNTKEAVMYLSSLHNYEMGKIRKGG